MNQEEKEKTLNTRKGRNSACGYAGISVGGD